MGRCREYYLQAQGAYKVDPMKFDGCISFPFKTITVDSVVKGGK